MAKLRKGAALVLRNFIFLWSFESIWPRYITYQIQMLRKVLRKIHIPAGLRQRIPILCRKFLFEWFKVGVLPNQQEWNIEFDIQEEPNNCGIELYPNCGINDIIQGGYFDWSAQISVPKWKTIGSQSEILFNEILDVQKILVGWTMFFFSALKFGRTS